MKETQQKELRTWFLKETLELRFQAGSSVNAILSCWLLPETPASLIPCWHVTALMSSLMWVAGIFNW